MLITTGAMNPVHQGHVALLAQAARRLEAEGYAVVKAYLSPSHDNYVQPKMIAKHELFLSGAFRVHVAQLAVAKTSNPKVEVDKWESTQARAKHSYPDFPEVT